LGVYDCTTYRDKKVVGVFVRLRRFSSTIVSDSFETLLQSHLHHFNDKDFFLASPFSLDRGELEVVVGILSVHVFP
jgi:hypothetical protein